MMYVTTIKVNDNVDFRDEHLRSGDDIYDLWMMPTRSENGFVEAVGVDMLTWNRVHVIYPYENTVMVAIFNGDAEDNRSIVDRVAKVCGGYAEAEE